MVTGAVRHRGPALVLGRDRGRVRTRGVVKGAADEVAAAAGIPKKAVAGMLKKAATTMRLTRDVVATRMSASGAGQPRPLAMPAAGTSENSAAKSRRKINRLMVHLERMRETKEKMKKRAKARGPARRTTGPTVREKTGPVAIVKKRAKARRPARRTTGPAVREKIGPVVVVNLAARIRSESATGRRIGGEAVVGTAIVAEADEAMSGDAAEAEIGVDVTIATTMIPLVAIAAAAATGTAGGAAAEKAEGTRASVAARLSVRETSRKTASATGTARTGITRGVATKDVNTVIVVMRATAGIVTGRRTEHASGNGIGGQPAAIIVKRRHAQASERKSSAAVHRPKKIPPPTASPTAQTTGHGGAAPSRPLPAIVGGLPAKCISRRLRESLICGSQGRTKTVLATTPGHPRRVLAVSPPRVHNIQVAICVVYVSMMLAPMRID